MRTEKCPLDQATGRMPLPWTPGSYGGTELGHKRCKESFGAGSGVGGRFLGDAFSSL